MDEEIKKEKEVTEAETKEIENGEIAEEEKEEMNEEDVAKKKKREFYFELALFLILGILIGIALKTEASKRVTIGYEDYKMKIKRQDFNLNNLQSELGKIEEQEEQNSPTQEEELQTAPAEEDLSEEIQSQNVPGEESARE